MSIVSRNSGSAGVLSITAADDEWDTHRSCMKYGLCGLRVGYGKIAGDRVEVKGLRYGLRKNVSF